MKTSELNKECLFDLIVSEGLTIRQIPTEVIEKINLNMFPKNKDLEKNEELIEEDFQHKGDYSYHHLKKVHGRNPSLLFNDFDETIKRQFIKRTTIPNDSGYWMCKKSQPNTSSSTTWNKRIDNLAPTLPESIELFLSKQENEK